MADLDRYYGKGYTEASQLFGTRRGSVDFDNINRVKDLLEKDISAFEDFMTTCYKHLKDHQSMPKKSKLISMFAKVECPHVYRQLAPATDVSAYLYQESREDLIRNLLKTLEADVDLVDRAQTGWAIVVEELAYLLERGGITPYTLLKRFKIDIRHARKLQEPAKIAEDLQEAVGEMRMLIERLLVQVLNLKKKMVKFTMLDTDLALFRRLVCPKYAFKLISFKIVDNGLITDDGQPHSIDHTVKSGILQIVHTKSGEEALDAKSAFDMVQVVHADYVASYLRLFGPVTIDEEEVSYEEAVIDSLVTIVAEDYISVYNAACNFLKRLSEEGKVPDYVRSLSTLSMTLVTLFRQPSDVVERWIGAKMNGAKDLSAQTLFLSATLEEEKNNPFVIYDELAFAKVQRQLVLNYLCNTLYLITHAQAGEHTGIVQVFVHTDSDDGTDSYLMKMCSISRDTATISKFAAPGFQRMLGSRFKSFNMIATTDRQKNILLNLKSPRSEGDLASRNYQPVLRLGEKRLASALEVIAEYILTLSEQKHFKDVYIATPVILRGKYTIAPHLPYRYLGGAFKESKLLFELEDFDNVLGVNDKTYEAPVKFTIENTDKFDMKGEILNSYTVKSLLAHIDVMAVEFLVNWWFTKRIYEHFSDYQLAHNFETVHMSGVDNVNDYHTFLFIQKMQRDFMHDGILYTLIDSAQTEQMMHVYVRTSFKHKLHLKAEYKTETNANVDRDPMQDRENISLFPSPKRTAPPVKRAAKPQARSAISQLR